MTMIASDTTLVNASDIEPIIKHIATIRGSSISNANIDIIAQN